MTARLLTVIGGGEHARVVIESARSRPDLWTVEGFTDLQPCEDTAQRLGVPWLGDDTRALARPAAERFYILGIGQVGVGDKRKKIVEHYAQAGVQFAAIIHAQAIVSPTAHIADGAVVFAGSVVQTGAKVGPHTVVGTGAIVEHDVELGAFTQLGPGAVLGGGVVVGENVYLGLGCRVRDHITIGDGALVGMGAVVTANVAGEARVLGVPARAW